jgi:hypothetical protein
MKNERKKNIHEEEKKIARGYSAEAVGKPETRDRFPAPCSFTNHLYSTLLTNSQCFGSRFESVIWIRIHQQYNCQKNLAPNLITASPISKMLSYTYLGKKILYFLLKVKQKWSFFVTTRPEMESWTSI